MPGSRRGVLALAAVVTALAACASGASAAPPLSGAIFTTLPDGSEVNFNIYADKDDVYLDGGPGPGAPQHAAGLPNGTYVFQVTDPSGKVLLSTDPARCRQFTVAGGIITGVVDTDCEHLTGVDVDHGATTVQLMPYLDTPNPGGVYKVWATPLADFLRGCEKAGEDNGLDVVDCGNARGGIKHGFIPGASKTDNFKVGDEVAQEIDTRFFDAEGTILDGRGITWTDPTGASNNKWSYWAPQLQVFHEAHVEAVQAGVHKITIDNQPGCSVGRIVAPGFNGNGPQTVSVKAPKTQKAFTIFVDVFCQ